MPIGSFSLLYHYADHLQKHRPKKVLDLGIGFGMMGALVRQYLDDGVQPWRTELVGVEGWRRYRNPAWELYDIVQQGNILDYVKGTIESTTYKPDFIIFSDVIEHLDKEVGRILIHDLIELLSPGGVLMIGTPGIFVEQNAVHGNHLEIHRSLWAWNEFPPGFEVIKNGEPDEFKHRMILVKYVKPV